MHVANKLQLITVCVPLWETFYYSTCVRPSVGDILLQHMCASLCGRHSTTAHVCVPLWETFYYSTCVRPSVGDILLQHMCSHVQSSYAVPEFGTFHKDFGPHELLYSIQFTSLYLLNSKLHRLPIINALHHTISPGENIFPCLAQEQCRHYEV